MFLTILQIIWQLGILIWIVYSSVFTIRSLLDKLGKEKDENDDIWVF